MADDDEVWWHVSGHVTVSADVYVRARSAKEALRLARKRSPTLAPYGIERSGVDPTENAVIEAADGEFVPSSAEVDDPPDGYPDGEE